MAYPFAAAEVLTAVDLNAMIGAPTQNAITTVTYTAVLLDAGKTVTLSNASAVTLTIPAQATVAWAANTQLNILNIGAGTVTITPAAGVTINGTPLTLATSKGGSLVRTASNVWTFIPFSGGVEAANFTNTATGTYTTGGIQYKFLTFTGSGSLVVDRAGFADVLVIGGGGSGAQQDASGGGAGGHLSLSQVYLPAGTLGITIGAGGARSNLNGAVGGCGTASILGGLFFGVGGGSGASPANLGNYPGVGGGSGGGGAGNGSGGIGVTGQGSNGGAGANGGAANGGGGGAGAVGVTGAGTTGGAGGAGASNSLTNSPVTRGGGGGGSGSGTAGAGGSGGGGAGAVGAATATNGDTNLGGGGGGSKNAGAIPGNGGSGLIIVRVVV